MGHRFAAWGACVTLCARVAAAPASPSSTTTSSRPPRSPPTLSADATTPSNGGATSPGSTPRSSTTTPLVADATTPSNGGAASPSSTTTPLVADATTPPNGGATAPGSPSTQSGDATTPSGGTEGSTSSRAAPSTAKPPNGAGAAAAAVARGCQAPLYADPMLLAGVISSGTFVARVRLSLGLHFVRCLPGKDVELKIGGYAESGSRAIGDALSAGFALELSDVFRGLRFGATLHVDPVEVRTVSVGALVHVDPFTFGVEGVYSGRAYHPGAVVKEQPAAVGALATFGFSGKAGAYVSLAVLLVLGIASLGRGNG